MLFLPKQLQSQKLAERPFRRASQAATRTSPQSGSGAAYSPEDLQSSPGQRGSVPASLPRSHRGAQRVPRLPWGRTVGVGTGHRLLSRCNPERSSARAGTQPGLLPQPWTCGAVCSSDARAGPSHPAPLAQSASRRLHPGHAHRTPPASAPCPWLRPPGCCKTQMPEAGSRPGELAVPAEDRQDSVARRVFLGKPLLRHSFILLKASGCSLK